MGISFSNIGTVGREQLITSGSNGEPNWSYIPSKGKSTKTQNEFVSEIKKLAQKAANATDKTEQDSVCFRTCTTFVNKASSFGSESILFDLKQTIIKGR